jgi:hypothetical protein
MAASAARALLAVSTVASKSFIVASPDHLSIDLAIRPVNFPASRAGSLADEGLWPHEPARVIGAAVRAGAAGLSRLLRCVDRAFAAAILRAPSLEPHADPGGVIVDSVLVDGIWPRAILPPPCFGPMRP